MSQPVTLVFVIYRYFPFGGAQRDFMRILLACQARGFAIHVFALKWEGEIPEGVTVTLAPCKALSRTALYNIQVGIGHLQSPFLLEKVQIKTRTSVF